jgi:hypothetical protein
MLDHGAAKAEPAHAFDECNRPRPDLPQAEDGLPVAARRAGMGSQDGATMRRLDEPRLRGSRSGCEYRQRTDQPKEEDSHVESLFRPTARVYSDEGRWAQTRSSRAFRANKPAAIDTIDFPLRHTLSWVGLAAMLLPVPQANPAPATLGVSAAGATMTAATAAHRMM